MNSVKMKPVLTLSAIILAVTGLAMGANWESAAQKRKVDQKVQAVNNVVRHGLFRDNLESLKKYQVPQWYRDAKFGIFIHWGLYSVPAYANEWYSRNMYQEGDDAFKHHVATYGPQSKFGYKDFIPMFKAENYDPDHWADVFKEAGARYVVPVAEHHDGFALYNSDFSNWTAKKMGPKRDVIGDLAKAVRKAGLVFGLSSHRAEHWWFMNGGMKFDSDVKDPKYAEFYGPAEPDNTVPDDKYLRNWLARSCELVDKYHPQVVYFDWWVGEKPVFKPYLDKFTAYYYDRAAQRKNWSVLNTKDKAYVKGTSVMDVEKGKLTGINPEPWQTDTTISYGSWGYLKDDHYKKADLLVRNLVDIVSKNGNLLLDIGPKPDGTIPKEEEEVLLDMGQWLKANGEAIYGTRPWVTFGEGPTQEQGGKFSEGGDYKEGDIRFTLKGNTLYILSLLPPTHSIKAAMLGKKASPALVIDEVSLLGSDEKIKWERNDQALVLPNPPKKGVMPVVYKAVLKGACMGGTEVQAQGQTLTGSASFQNYEDTDLVKSVTLLVDGKEVASEEVTVAPLATGRVEIKSEMPNAGIYHVSVETDGYPAFASKAALPAMDLSGEWLFHRGDDPTWSKPDLDEKDWEKVKLPASWEDHSNYKCEQCFGWYRKKVVIPAEWKGHSLVIPLGKIDDVDFSYLNGKEIGRMGKLPPNYDTAWNKERHYEVPAGLVHFGGENVIAIRNYNGPGGAGLYEGPLGPIEVK